MKIFSSSEILKLMELQITQIMRHQCVGCLLLVQSLAKTVTTQDPKITEPDPHKNILSITIVMVKLSSKINKMPMVIQCQQECYLFLPLLKIIRMSHRLGCLLGKG